MGSLKCVSWCGVLAATLVLSGCGGSTDGRVPVAGEVMLSGQPLDRGSIEFHPLGEGGVITGGMIVDGKFDIDAEQGAKPGKYEVRVFSSGEAVEADPDQAPGPEAETQINAERIAAKYNIDSELEVEIGANGDRGLRFEVAGP